MPKKKPAAPVPDDVEFGLNWTKAGWHGLPELNKRIYCARHGRGNVSVFEHRKAIIRILFPEYEWHQWTERRVESISKLNFVTWWGPGGSGKTSDAAIGALEYWAEAPYETAVIVCSTTKDMLRTRIWGEIVKWHGRIKPEHRALLFPEGYGELLDASCFIRWVPGDWKNGIKGVAVQDGPVEEAINNIIGMHTTRVLVILDEMQGVREAIMGAIPNLLKNPESKFVGMGNPSDINSLLCRYSEPLGGWKTIKKYQPEWEIDSAGYTGRAMCLFFDGYQSPAILDPEWGKRNPWMINQAQIDSHLNSKRVGGNENHPDFMWQSRGWPPEKGLEETVLDGAIISKFLCKDTPIWTNGFVEQMSLDPVYEGGDDAVLHIMRRGLVREVIEDTENNMLTGPVMQERWVVAGVEQMVVPIDSESKIPVDYQIVNFVKGIGKKRNIPAHETAVGSAGRGAALCSIFDVEWGPVVRIEEGGAPSDRPIDERGRTAREFYNTRASELCMLIQEFALGNGLRNLPQDVITQACARLTYNLNGKLCVEPKTATKGLVQAKGTGAKGFKQRMGYSPDALDSWNIGLEHARLKGAVPNFGMASPIRAEQWNTQVKKESEVEDYTEDTDWRDEFENMYA